MEETEMLQLASKGFICKGHLWGIGRHQSENECDENEYTKSNP